MPKANLGKGKNPSCGDRALSTLKRKMYQYLNGVRILNISSSLISDNFLLFILLEIFLHSDEHGSQVSWPLYEPLVSEELFKLKVNKFFFTYSYFQPAAVITSNAAAWFFP